MSTPADFPDWQAPQAHATAISTTGVPLLTKSVLLLNALPAILGGLSYSSATLSVSQTGYEIRVSGTIPSAATIPFFEVFLLWEDSTSGLTVATDSFIIPAVSAGAGLLVRGTGPTKGDRVVVEVNNLDPAQTLTAAVTVLLNSRTYAGDDWCWMNPFNSGVVVPGIPLAAQPPDETVLGIGTSLVLPASGSVSRLCGMGARGWVNLAGNTATTPFASIIATVFPQPASVYGGGGIAFRQQLSQSQFAFTFRGVRAPLLVQFNNTSATAGVVSFMLNQT